MQVSDYPDVCTITSDFREAGLPDKCLRFLADKERKFRSLIDKKDQWVECYLCITGKFFKETWVHIQLRD